MIHLYKENNGVDIYSTYCIHLFSYYRFTDQKMPPYMMSM